MLGVPKNQNNNGNNNNSNRPMDPTVYSSYRFANYDSPLGMVGVSFSFWSGLLKIVITPMVRKNGQVSYDSDNEVYIHLAHSKARIFSNEIKKFLEDPVNYNGCGVLTGTGEKTGLITISNGSDYKIQNPCLVIRKIDSNGNIVSDIAYPFKSELYSIRNINNPDMTLLNDTDMTNNVCYDYNDIEIQELVTILDTFVEAMTNSMAYSVINSSKWDLFRTNKKIDDIADALGVKRNRQSSGRSNNFFNGGGNNNNRSYNSNYGDMDY